MREILFRGKRLGDGEWVFGDLYHRGKEIVITSFYAGHHIAVDPATVGQFTGLLDKDGKRIFEGDIATLDREDGFFVIEFQEDTARFVMSGDCLLVDFDNFWNYEIEVIGNIHDNPELLEANEDG